MTQPMDYEGYLALGRIAEHGWETSAERAALAFIRAAVPWMKKRGHERGCKQRGFAAAYGDECTCGLDALTATFPDDFGDKDATV